MTPLICAAKSGGNFWEEMSPAISTRYSCVSSDYATQEADTSSPLGATPDSWGANNRVPAHRAYSSPVVIGGKVVYFGGGHGDYWGNDVEVFDPDSNAWEQSARPNTIYQGGGGGSEYGYIRPADGLLRPFQIHGYGRQLADSDLGKMVCAASFVTSPGSGPPYSYLTATSQFCLIAFDHSAKIWSIVNANIPNTSFLTPYDPVADAVFSMQGSGGSTIVQRLNRDGTYDSLSNLTGAEIVATNSACIYDTQRAKHVIARLYPSGGLFEYDSDAHSYANVTSQLPSALQSVLDGNFAMAYSTASHKLFAFTCEGTGPTGQVEVWVGTHSGSAWNFVKRDTPSSSPLIGQDGGSNYGFFETRGIQRVQYDSTRDVFWMLYPNSSGTEKLWRYTP